MCGVALFSGIASGGAKSICTAIFWAVTGLIFLYLTFIKPKVEIGEEGIIVFNPVIRAHIGWSDVVDLGAKWNLYIRTSERTINVWAAPAPGRRHNRKIHASEVRGMKSASYELIAPAVSPRSESGIALHLAEVSWNEFQKRAEKQTLVSEYSRDWRGLIALSIFLLAALSISLIQ